MDTEREMKRSLGRKVLARCIHEVKEEWRRDKMGLKEQRVY
jgi:hypothetical protein